MAVEKPMKGRMRRAAQRFLRRKGDTPEQRQIAKRRFARRVRNRGL